MKNALTILTIFFFGLSSLKASVADSLLKVLDKELNIRNHYEQQKNQRIAVIKTKLTSPSLTQEDAYHLNKTLYQEYESYICDSALSYINKNIEIATNVGNEQWLLSSKLSKLSTLIASGLFVEGMSYLKALPRHQLKGDDLLNYYVAYSNIHLYLAEYTTPEYGVSYMQTVNSYSDSILSIVPKGSHQYIITQSQILLDQQKWNEAKDLLQEYVSRQSSDSHEYAVATSTLAFVHHLLGDKEKEKETRILSAIADIRAVVKESYSLCALAELLYDEGQLDRANRYIKISMEVTNKYKARLRSYQAASILPLIDQAWQKEKDEQEHRQLVLTIMACVLACILAIAVIYVILQMKKLRITRQQVVEANNDLKNLNEELLDVNKVLTEANCVKEEYLGRFLQQCSLYIDKLEEYRRVLNKKASERKLDELYALLKSNQMIDKELKEFYHNFDTSFLKIFPKFVEEFNRLLPEEEQIIPKNTELLTAELRIFALIRLGITDSTKIAAFLRYSITTIYTYRSRIRKKSFYKEDFEERVMKITSF